MLTIFSIPKPFTGHSRTIQTNALRSWTLLPDCEVILFGDDDGVAEAAAEHGARHLAGVATNERGTPRLDWVFGKAQQIASHDRLCYVNADVVLMSDLLAAVAAVDFPRFVLVGQRWDVEITELLEFDEDWQERLREFTQRTGELHEPSALDYFAFSRGLWTRMPPFVVGRPGWDNWMIYQARAEDAPVIDATQAVMVVHQQHDYGHHPQGKAGVWTGEEARSNIEAAGGPAKVLFGIPDATWVLRGGDSKPQRNLRWRHLRRGVHTLPVLHRWLWPLGPLGQALVRGKNYAAGRKRDG